MSTTVSVTTSPVSFVIDANASITINSGAAIGSIAFTSANDDIWPSFSASLQSKTHGPFGVAMSVVITVSQASITYQINGGVGGFGYDSSNNVTGLVGPNGYPLPVYTFNPNSMALLGDSITLRNQQAPGIWNCEGYFTVANMLMNQKYDLVNVSGFSGYTIEQIATAGLDAVVASGARNCFVLAGTNNVFDSTASVIYDKLVSLLWAPLQASGLQVIVATIPPNTGWTTTRSAKMALVNSMIRASGFPVCDLWRATVDSLTGAPRTGLFGDGIHPAARGAMYFAREIQRVCTSINNLPVSKVSGGALDPLIFSPNPLATGNNANGTNGFVLGVGGTGTGPAQWTVKTSNAGSTFTCSGDGARNPVDYLDGKALDVALTYRAADDDYFSVGLSNGADIHLDRAWAATTAKVAGTLVKPTTGRAGFQYKCIVSGTTGGSQPTWPTTAGGTVVDGTCTWMAIADMAPGDVYQLQIELVFSALTGQVAPWMKVLFDDSGYSGVLRPGIVVNGATVTSPDANAISPAYNLGTPAFDYVPLNTAITIKSQPIVVPQTGVVSHVAPEFRLYGKASATATFKVQNFELRRIS